MWEDFELTERRRQLVRRGLEILGWLTAILIFAFASHEALAQSTREPHVTVTVRPAQSAEERVADEVKERELRRAAAEKEAAAEAARIAETSPRALLARARTVFITSSTSFFEPVQLQNALRRREEMDAWQLALVDGWDKRDIADLLINIDRPLFTYTFLYKLTDRRTGIILATGKVTAFDGNAAAPKLAKRIVEEMKRARGEAREDKR
ncbi:MAG TPA: hypothetical protein VGV59_07210 [Pyrinomonadaceae bacterium]|nr:hypothetical protein [Pyrinomonadaceae bacterium]